MQQITRRSVKRSPSGHQTPLGAPQALLLMSLLIVGFMMAAILVTIQQGSAVDSPLFDPFAAFSDRFPGQQLSARQLEAEGFTCVLLTVPVPGDYGEHCTLYLDTGPFSSLSVTGWDGVIILFDVKLRENSVKIGDLIDLWGEPRLRIHSNAVIVRWPDRAISAIGKAQTGRVVFFKTLSQITFAM
jgi:hypothetical protein